MYKNIKLNGIPFTSMSIFVNNPTFCDLMI